MPALTMFEPPDDLLTREELDRIQAKARRAADLPRWAKIAYALLIAAGLIVIIAQVWP